MIWSKEEEIILKENYGQTPVSKFSHLLPQKTRNAIYSRAYYLGLSSDITNKQYSLNDNFFDSPNITNCYWAGFLGADGNLGTYGGSKYIQIRIHEKDKCILDRFKLDTNCTTNIGKVKNQPHIFIKTFISNECFENLKTHWNLTPRKTYTLEPPNLVEIEHKLAYIVGSTDGDGTICTCNFTQTHSGKKYIYPAIKFSLCGTRSLMEWCSEVLNSVELPHYNKLKVEKARQSDSLFYIRCDKKRARLILQRLMETKTPWRLPRKWDLVANL